MEYQKENKWLMLRNRGDNSAWALSGLRYRGLWIEMVVGVLIIIGAIGYGLFGSQHPLMWLDGAKITACFCDTHVSWFYAVDNADAPAYGQDVAK